MALPDVFADFAGWADDDGRTAIAITDDVILQLGNFGRFAARHDFFFISELAAGIVFNGASTTGFSGSVLVFLTSPTIGFASLF